VNLGLAVHENTHTLLTSNWGGSSSFFNEGFARYAESMATSPERDRAATREFLAAGRLPPLAEMLGMNVGADPRTDVGYPAAGALVRYLVDTYGLDVSRRVWRLQAGGNSDRAWAEVFNRPLAEIEREWMAWLRAK
jgi:hypothetical protein